MPSATRLPAPLSTAPFTAAEAASFGLTRRALQGGAVRTVFRGVYVSSELELTDVVYVSAAIKAVGSPSVVSGVTTLRLLGVELAPILPVHLESTHPHQARRPGIVVHRVSRLPPRRGHVASAEHSFLRACATLDLLEAVTAGDWVLHLRRSTLSSLESYIGSYAGQGVRRARRALALVKERVESPRETRLRLALVLAGLPTPECNLTLGDAEGPIGRVDLVFIAYRIIVEYEGDQHRTDRGQWNRDIDRLEAFSDAGYVVIRVTAQRMRFPRDVVERVHDKLRQAGYRGPQPRYGPEWWQLFEAPRQLRS